MSTAKKDYKRVTVKSLVEMKSNGEKISMLTGYDYTMAKIIDGAGIDVILVGDSASNVMAGHETTLPITLDQMIYHASSVIRAIDRALVVVDLPFGSYQSDPKEALRSRNLKSVVHLPPIQQEGMVNDKYWQLSAASFLRNYPERIDNIHE